MANKEKEKSSGEMLVEEIEKLGRTHGMNTVFTNFLELTALALAIQMDPVNQDDILSDSCHTGVPIRSKRYSGGSLYQTEAVQ